MTQDEILDIFRECGALLESRVDRIGERSGGSFEIFVGFGVVQGKEEIDGIAGGTPVEDGFALRGDLGHADRVGDVPIAVEVEAAAIETNTAVGDAIGVGEGEDVPEDTVAKA